MTIAHGLRFPGDDELDRTAKAASEIRSKVGQGFPFRVGWIARSRRSYPPVPWRASGSPPYFAIATSLSCVNNCCSPAIRAASPRVAAPSLPRTDDTW
jgi:hypothetical protein